MIFDNFERKLLFRITRLTALAVVAVLLIGILIEAVGAMHSWRELNDPSSHVHARSVLRRINKKPDKARVGRMVGQSHSTPPPPNNKLAVLKEVRIPQVLGIIFSEEQARKVLAYHLRHVSPRARQEYLDNMAEVVDAERKAHVIKDPTKAVRGEVSAINAYMDLKDAKLLRIRAARPALRTKILYTEIVAAILLGLVALFSLVLVLLAIERNTRPKAAE